MIPRFKLDFARYPSATWGRSRRAQWVAVATWLWWRDLQSWDIGLDRPNRSWSAPGVLNTVVYFIILLGCSAYTVMRGSAPEQIGAAILLLGSILTLVTLSSPATIYSSLEVGVFLVDVATFVAFLILALRADRLWPLCITAFQLVGTAGHAVKMVDPEVLPYAYAFALRFWGY